MRRLMSYVLAGAMVVTVLPAMPAAAATQNYTIGTTITANADDKYTVTPTATGLYKFYTEGGSGEDIDIDSDQDSNYYRDSDNYYDNDTYYDEVRKNDGSSSYDGYEIARLVAGKTYTISFDNDGKKFTFKSDTYSDGIDNGFYYETVGNQAVVTGYAGTATDVTIPATLGGKAVTRIKYMADADDVVKVTLPSTVTKVDAGAFFGLNKLTNIVVPASVTQIGKKAFGYFARRENMNAEYKDGYSYYTFYKTPGFTITCDPGTAAEAYANANGFAKAPLTMPAATKVKKAKRKGTKLIVTVKKRAGVKYQIQVSTKKNFKKKFTTTKKTSKTKVTLKKIKKNKKYIRVRTYKTIFGKKYYSAWSKVKKVK